MSLIEIGNEYGRALISSHAGATLRSLRVKAAVFEYELLSGGLNGRLDEAVTPSGVGSFIMAPWVNRMHRGLLVTDHGEFNLPLDSDEHTIHGTVRRVDWDVVSVNADSAQLQTPLKEPWPFAGHVVYTVSMAGQSLVQTLEVHAADGERAFPTAVGWHPWFRRSLGSDELVVQADVKAEWELDEHVVPSGKVGPTDASRKLNAGGQFKIGEVDGCFQFKNGGHAQVRWPELTLRMESSPEISHVMVYSPKDSICVEPQTSAVNAFQLAARGVEGTGTQTASPGKPLVATTTWSWATV